MSNDTNNPTGTTLTRAELKRWVVLTKQLQEGRVPHPLGGFLILFVLLSFQLFG